MSGENEGYVPPEHIENPEQQDSFDTNKTQEGSFEISSKGNVDISYDSPLEIEVTISKEPNEIGEGMSINSIEIDSEGERLHEAIQKAQGLKEIPLEDRPRKVMELVREYINYAYPEDVEELRKTDSNKADFIEANLGVESLNSLVKLSQVFENGYGVCRHLSVAALVLGKEAGLEGMYATSPIEAFGVKNILHPETKEKLFKLTELDRRTGQHAWVEFKVGEDWISVDPSTQIVADNQQELEVFQQAEYVADFRRAVTVSNLPENLHVRNEGFAFGPGDRDSNGKLLIEPKTFISLKESIPGEPFSGSLRFTVTQGEDETFANRIEIATVIASQAS